MARVDDDAREVAEQTGIDARRAAQMLEKLQVAGMPREDRRTSLIYMLNTPPGDAYGADAGRAWAVLQP